MFIENKTGQEDFSVEFNKACDEAFVMFSKLTLSEFMKCYMNHRI